MVLLDMIGIRFLKSSDTNSYCMYDYVKLTHSDIPPPLRTALENGVKDSIEFNGVIYGYDGRKEGNPKFQARIDNLIVQVSSLGTIVFNSIHKYYDGYNNSDFTLSNFKEAIEKLSDITLIDWFASKPNKLEVGANIQISDVQFYLNSLYSYGTKYFIEMNERGKYGKKVRLTNFDIKVYNKSYQTPLIFKPLPNLLRFEIFIKRMDKEHPNITTVSQLCNVNLARELRSNMLKKNDKILIHSIPNFETLTLKEKTIYSRYSNRAMAESIKRNHPDTYKKDITIYRKLIHSVEPCIGTEVSENLREKSGRLLLE